MHESLDEFKFRPDTTTNSRVICPCASETMMYNVVSTLAPSFLIGSSSFLQVTRTTIKSQTSSKFDQIQPWTVELAALGHLEKSLLTYNGRNLVNTLAPSFLIGSSSFLQVTRTCMKAWMSSNFGKFATELRPLIDVRIKFLLNILKTNRPIKTKFCIHNIIDKIYVILCKFIVFSKFATELPPLIDVRTWFLLNFFSTNRQIETKFCIHISLTRSTLVL